MKARSCTPAAQAGTRPECITSTLIVLTMDAGSRPWTDRSPPRSHRERFMKIVQVSRTDGGDGASNVALRVHRGLLRLGHESSMFVAQRRGDPADSTVTVY